MNQTLRKAIEEIKKTLKRKFKYEHKRHNKPHDFQKPMGE